MISKLSEFKNQCSMIFKGIVIFLCFLLLVNSESDAGLKVYSKSKRKAKSKLKIKRPEHTISYKSFKGQKYDLYPWMGRKICILSKKNDHDLKVMAKIVDTWDRAYEFYTECAGAEPRKNKQYEGRGIIAEVDDSCGAGCGILGGTGIELTGKMLPGFIKKVETKNAWDQMLFYEMGRNFWLGGWFDRLEMKTDDGGKRGAVATMYAILMRHMVIEELELTGYAWGKDWKGWVKTMEDKIDFYIDAEDRNWENTFKIASSVPGCRDVKDLWASMVMRLKKDHGGMDFIKGLWSSVHKLPKAKSSQDAADNFFVACCMAAKKNLAEEFVKVYKWKITKGAAKKVERLPKYKVPRKKLLKKKKRVLTKR